MSDVIPDPMLVVPMHAAIRGAADGLTLETDEEVDEFIERLASIQWSFVRLADDDFPFWEAKKLTQDEAPYTQWGTSLITISEVLRTFMQHAERVYRDDIVGGDEGDDTDD